MARPQPCGVLAMAQGDRGCILPTMPPHSAYTCDPIHSFLHQGTWVGCELQGLQQGLWVTLVEDAAAGRGRWHAWSTCRAAASMEQWGCRSCASCSSPPGIPGRGPAQSRCQHRLVPGCS